jgi:hypothetical protein
MKFEANSLFSSGAVPVQWSPIQQPAARTSPRRRAATTSLFDPDEAVSDLIWSSSSAANGVQAPRGSTSALLVPDEGGGPVSLGAADVSRQWNFDGSGFDDFVFLDPNLSTRLTIQASSGGIYTTPSLAAPSGEVWRLFALGDVNGDRLCDVIWMTGDNQFRVQLTSATGGVASFTLGNTGSAGMVFSFLAVGDLNGDGRVDLIRRDLSTGGVRVDLTNFGGFYLGALAILANSLSYTWSLAGTGDLNNDGRDDLLWRNVDGTVVAWLMNSGGLTFTAATLPSVGHEWRVETIARLNTGDISSDVLWRNMVTGTGLVWRMSTGGPLSVVGTSAFGPINGDRMFYGMRYDQSANDSTPGGFNSILWHTNNSLVLTELNSVGTPSRETPIRYDFSKGHPLAPNLWQAFDFGARNNALWYSNGYAMRTRNFGSLSAAQGGTGRVGVLNVTTGRFDMLYASGGGLQLFAPNGTGGTPLALNRQSTPSGMGDFNNDGSAIDLLVTTDGSIQVYVWNGSSYNAPVSTGISFGSSLRLVAIGNFDGQLGDELVFDFSDGEVGFLKFDATGGFNQYLRSAVIPPNQIIQGAADLNGDGRDDLVYRDATSGSVSYWVLDTNLSVMSLNPINTTPVTLEWDLVGFGNLDGDGDDDIIWRRNTDGFTVAWIMQGGGISSVSGIAAPGWDWRFEGTSDLNGDGKTDLIWRNASGQYAAYLMNGASISSVITSNTLAFDRLTVGWTQAVTRG